MKRLNIAVIGAGWFGCHIAYSLIKEGHDVTLYERNSDIFSEASSKNQFRLHMGFHYPRSYNTRKKMLDYYNTFIKEYPNFVSPIENNIYSIAKNDSLIDFNTYLQILDGTNIPYRVDGKDNFNLSNMEGLIYTDEMYFNLNEIKIFFNKILSSSLTLNHNINDVEVLSDGVMVNENKHDFCINCTYNQFNKVSPIENHFIPSILLVYKCKNSKLLNSSITVMDGNFFSLYPYLLEDKLFTLSNVKYTHLGKFETIDEANDLVNNLTHKNIEEIRINMEDSVSKYYSNFKLDFEYHSYFTANKVFFRSGSSNRECIVHVDGKMINVFSGKVTEIFTAEKEVKKILKNEQ